MSTRWIIARPEGDGFVGRFVYSDGYPSGKCGAFAQLHELFEHFGDVETALNEVLAYNWSVIEPGITTFKRTRGKALVPNVGVRYTRNNGGDELYGFPQYGTADTAYAYVVDVQSRRVTAFSCTFDDRTPPEYIGSVAVDDLLDAALDGRASKIECGEHYERCGHYAWYHFPEVDSSCRLSTSVYLGLDKPDYHDVVAVVIDGDRIELGGSGGLGTKYSSRQYTDTLLAKANVWWQSTKEGDEIRLAQRNDDGEYVPYHGVEWIFPPIKEAVT